MIDPDILRRRIREKIVIRELPRLPEGPSKGKVPPEIVVGKAAGIHLHEQQVQADTDKYYFDILQHFTFSVRVKPYLLLTKADTRSRRRATSFSNPL
jgi:hypothetical protein